MTRRSDAVAAIPAIHIALSSIELSLLGIVAFDPETLPATRAGQRINTIDADDSMTLRHTVPLDAWPEALWRALSGTIVGVCNSTAARLDVAALYAGRIVDPACPARSRPLPPQSA